MWPWLNSPKCESHRWCKLVGPVGSGSGKLNALIHLSPSTLTSQHTPMTVRWDILLHHSPSLFRHRIWGAEWVTPLSPGLQIRRPRSQRRRWIGSLWLVSQWLGVRSLRTCFVCRDLRCGCYFYICRAVWHSWQGLKCHLFRLLHNLLI